jgi:predicted transcriptional regulator YheO
LGQIPRCLRWGWFIRFLENIPTEKIVNPLLERYLTIATAIARTFGDNCEVLLHDISDLKHSVVGIENGHVTGRSIGAPLTDLGLYFLNSDIFRDTQFVANYYSESEDGKKLKSTTIFIRNDAKKIIGFLCINFAIDGLQYIARKITDFCEMEKEVDKIGGKWKNHEEETFTSTLDLLVDKMFDRALQNVGKRVEKMQKDDKIQVVRFLHRQGAFLVNGIVDEVAKRLNVSRYTVYNYLAAIKKEKAVIGRVK